MLTLIIRRNTRPIKRINVLHEWVYSKVTVDIIFYFVLTHKNRK